MSSNVMLALADCPIGLFRSESGELCVKTEYGTIGGRIDAYIVSSGEFFWGGAKRPNDQRQVLVQPVDLDAVNAALRTASAVDRSGAPFRFRRYVDGVEMAEGVEISKATTVQEAFLAARRIYRSPPGMDLVLEVAAQSPSGFSAGAEAMREACVKVAEQHSERHYNRSVELSHRSGEFELRAASDACDGIAREISALPLPGETQSSEGPCPVPPGNDSPVSTQTACELEGERGSGQHALGDTARRMSDNNGSLALGRSSQCEDGASPGSSDATHTCKRAGGFVDHNCMAMCDCHETMKIGTPAPQDGQKGARSQ